MIADNEILNTLAAHLESELKVNLMASKKIATKDLYDSIKVEVRNFTDSIKIIGKSLFYGKYVERGRKAGGKHVPISALISWVKQKRLATGNKAIHNMAWAVQKKIHREGIQPAHFVEKTLKDNTEYIRKHIFMAFEQIIKISIINMVAKTNQQINS